MNQNNFQEKAGKYAFKAGSNQLKKNVKSAIGIRKGRSSKPEINWNDLNFPPKMNLFHLTLSELNGDYGKRTKMLLLCWALVLFIFPLNFLNAIIQVAIGLSWTYIPSSILWYFVLIIANGFAFYYGYRSICENEELKLRYYIITGVILVFYIVQLLANILCFNSLVRVIRLFQAGKGGAGFFSLLEFLIWLGVFIFVIYNLVMMIRWDPDNVDTGDNAGSKKDKKESENKYKDDEESNKSNKEKESEDFESYGDKYKIGD